MTMVSDGQLLIGLSFDGPPAADCGRQPVTNCQPRTSEESIDVTGRQERWLPVFDQTHRWLDIYFSGLVPDFTPPLAPHGTPFRRVVWKFLLDIPYGETTTYGEIAARIAAQRAVQQGSDSPVTPRMSAQAVGGAVGHNPIAILIPCHRVIGTDGSLTGYAAGLDRKRCLLQLEQTGNVASLFAK